MRESVNVEVDKVEALTSSMIERAQTLLLLMKLVERATSLSVVKQFLKSKGLTHSASSWEEVRSKRIVPAVEDGKLSLNDLHGLLRKTEGFGRQHIFLFTCSPGRAAKMMAESRVKELLKEKGLDDVRESPLVVDLPDSPSIVDVVVGGAGENRFILFKEVEKRTTRKARPEFFDASSMTVTKVWDIEEHRVINVARLWANGVLEIRIASRDNTTRYHEDLGRFFVRLSPIIRREEFRETSLKQVKNNLWARKANLKDSVRFSTYRLENDEGMILQANASISTDDLADSEVLDKSLAEFQSDDSTYCSGSNIYMKPPGENSDWIHVLLNGEDNEFAITAAVLEEEYEYVLHQIQTYN